MKNLGKINRFYNSFYRQFENQREMRNFLDNERPTLYVALINSTWNPLCKKATQDLEELKREYPDAQFVVGNEDQDTRFAKYFDIKATPQYNIALHGRVVSHQVGSNIEGLRSKINRALKISSRSVDSELDQYVPHDMQLRRELEDSLIDSGYDVENDHYQFILNKKFKEDIKKLILISSVVKIKQKSL